CLVDGRDAVRIEAAAARRLVGPADLVGGDTRARRHPADRAEDRRGAGCGDTVVAARGGRRVGAVTGPVARRIEFEGEERVDRCVAAPAGVVIPRADQLLVAVAGVECLAPRAL